MRESSELGGQGGKGARGRVKVLTKASLQLLIPAFEERARAAMSAGRMREAVEVLMRLAKIAARRRLGPR